MTIPNFISNNFSGTPRPNHNHQHIPFNNLTGGYRKRLSGSRNIHENVGFSPEILVANSTPNSAHRQKTILFGRKGTVSTSHVPAIRGQRAPASGPRQGRKNWPSPWETACWAKILLFHDLSAMRILRSATDLGPRNLRHPPHGGGRVRSTLFRKIGMKITEQTKIQFEITKPHNSLR